METNSSESGTPGVEYGVARRLLATLEVVTAVLVAVALLVHAVRKRVLEARARTQLTLKGSVVLITSNCPFGRELTREFTKRGCTVALLIEPGTLEQTPSTLTLEPAPSILTFQCACNTKADARALSDEVRARLGQPIDVLALVNDDNESNSNGLKEIDDLVNKQLMRTCYLLESLVPLMRSGGRVLSAAREDGQAGYGCGEDTTHFARTRRSFADLLHTVTQQIADRRSDVDVTLVRLRGSPRVEQGSLTECAQGGGVSYAARVAVRGLCSGVRDITIPSARQHYAFRIRNAVQRTQQSIYKAIWRQRKIMT